MEAVGTRGTATIGVLSFANGVIVGGETSLADLARGEAGETCTGTVGGSMKDMGRAFGDVAVEVNEKTSRSGPGTLARRSSRSEPCARAECDSLAVAPSGRLALCDDNTGVTGADSARTGRTGVTCELTSPRPAKTPSQSSVQAFNSLRNRSVSVTLPFGRRVASPEEQDTLRRRELLRLCAREEAADDEEKEGALALDDAKSGLRTCCCWRAKVDDSGAGGVGACEDDTRAEGVGGCEDENRAGGVGGCEDENRVGGVGAWAGRLGRSGFGGELG